MTALVYFSFWFLGVMCAFPFFVHKKKYLLGETLYLSLDDHDTELLQSGKVCNARLSKKKELAQKAHGQHGLELAVQDRFY